MSLLNRNSILTGPVDSFCLACESYLRSDDDALLHVTKPIHKKNLDAFGFLDKFKEDHVRKVKNGYYCEYCNILMTTTAKVGPHVADQNHHKNKAMKPLKRKGNGVLAFDKVLIPETAWHGLIDDTCTVCDAEFDNPEIHKTGNAHVLKLVLVGIEFADENVYRKVDDSTFQCLTCNMVCATNTMATHFDTPKHMNLYQLCCKAENAKTIEPTETSKTVKEDKQIKVNEISNKETLKKEKVQKPKEQTKCANMGKADQDLCEALGAKDFLVRDGINGVYWCILCDWALEDDSVIVHMKCKHHLTMLRMHQKRTKEELIEFDTESKKKFSSEENKIKILRAVKEFNKSNVLLNDADGLAYCRACSKNIDFDFDFIKNHIDEHKKKPAEVKNVKSMSDSVSTQEKDLSAGPKNDSESKKEKDSGAGPMNDYESKEEEDWRAGAKNDSESKEEEGWSAGLKNDSESKKEKDSSVGPKNNSESKKEDSGAGPRNYYDSESKKEKNASAGPKNDSESKKEEGWSAGLKNDSESKKEKDSSAGPKNNSESKKEDSGAGPRNYYDSESKKEKNASTGPKNDSESKKEEDSSAGRKNDSESKKEKDSSAGPKNDYECNKENSSAGPKNDSESKTEKNSSAGAKNKSQSKKEEDSSAGRKHDSESKKEKDSSAGPKNDYECKKEKDASASPKNDSESKKEKDSSVGPKNDSESKTEKNSSAGAKNKSQSKKEKDSSASCSTCDFEQEISPPKKHKKGKEKACHSSSATSAREEDSELEILSKLHDLSYNSNNNTAFCRVCVSKIPPALKSMREHVKGANHQNKLAKVEPNENAVEKTPFCEYVNSFSTVENTLVKDVVINEQFCLNIMSFFLITRHGTKLRCQACEVNLAKTMAEAHKQSPCHERAMNHASVVTSEETEFIREIRPNVFHCGFCNVLESTWRDMETHLKSTTHRECKIAAYWRVQEYIPLLTQNKGRIRMEYSYLPFTRMLMEEFNSNE